MEEDDHDELLQCTDDESMSESEEQCVPIEKTEQKYAVNSHCIYTFAFAKVTLLLSSAFLIILYPLYFHVIVDHGGVYTGILFTSTTVFIILLISCVIAKVFFAKYNMFKMWRPPLRWRDLGKISVVYIISGFTVAYALDRERVMCHLQDPIKGTILVFSLLYYFIFCKKLMGLQRIFSTTIIIVGLFIALDYGLCDEFKCRGYDRESKAEDAGKWIFPVHFIWTGSYIVGVALFAAFFSIMERYIVPVEMVPIQTTVTTSLLTTISRIVSFQNSSGQFLSETRPLNATPRNKNPHSFLHLAFWIQLASFVFTIALFWVDLIPDVGSNDNINSFTKKVLNGLVCHFKMSTFPVNQNSCADVSLFGWLFALVLTIFILSATLFMIITQSAVYTVSTMSASIPLVGIWWSLFKMFPVGSDIAHPQIVYIAAFSLLSKSMRPDLRKRISSLHSCPIEARCLIEWAPTVSGELICSLLGFPIVLIGLGLFCKCHLKDCNYAKEVSQQNETAQFA